MTTGPLKPPLWAAAAAALLLSACSKPAPDPVMPAPPAVTKPGVTLTANPDPIIVDDGGSLGETNLSWTSSSAHTEIHISSPDGPLLVKGGPSGSARTGLWVTNGMKIFLQDGDNANPTSADATLGTLTIALQ
jgi:hypothetical protein